MNEKTILIGSPVCQKAIILKEFLKSLEELNKTNIKVSYIFIDDNKDGESSELLSEFKENNEDVILYRGEENKEKYLCDEYSHYWSEDIVDKVTRYKNFIIQTAIDKKYDYLFLIDSDLVMHPNGLEHLVKCDKEVVSNIFWTKWSPDGIEMPQVWMEDSYSFSTSYRKEGRSNLNIELEKIEFFEKLRIPGVYKVGGLGACTLIKRNVLEAGVNFSRLYNLSFWGEDRHFCIRAVANDFELFVDTFYPAYHIYREENLAGLETYKEENKSRDIKILGEHLFELIKEGISRYKNYNYKLEEDESYKLFMTNNFLENMNNENIMEDDNLIKECFITDYNMNFNRDLSELSGEVSYIEKGYRNNYSFYEEKIAHCQVVKLSKGVWRINKFDYIKDIEMEDKPIVRKASENPKLTLSMIVKNEGNRYLKEMLTKAKDYIDNAVIIDDCSEDNTVEIIEEVLKGCDYKIIRNNKSTFNTEHVLRKQQWNEVIKTNPEWVLFLDADEIFEDKFKDNIKELLKDREIDAYRFRLFDMWNENYFRSDELWYAHRTYRTFLIRYQENFDYKFNERNQHCGRTPENVEELLYKNSTLRLKHYGWSREADRINKYNRYLTLDKDGLYGNQNQYKSILDEKPKLEKWIE